ncbi:MAG: hypothetical protein ACO22T_10080 [Burkholderiales bacterium]
MKMKLMMLVAAMVAMPVFAADSTKAGEGPHGPRHEACKADPAKCQQERKAHREKMCAENPERCKEMQARMEEHRAQCKVDPSKCRPQGPGAPAQPRT